MSVTSRKIILVVMAGFLILIMTGCFGKVSEEKNKPIATVNDEVITIFYYEQLLERNIMAHRKKGEGLNKEERAKIEQQTLDDIIDEVLLWQEAQKKDYQVSDEIIKEELEKYRAQFRNDREFSKTMIANNLTMDDLKLQIANRIKIDRLIGEVVGDLSAEETEEALNKYLQDLRAKSDIVIMSEENE